MGERESPQPTPTDSALRESGPNRDRLRKRLGQVLAFAKKQLSSLDPAEEPWSEEIGPLVRLADKVATEAALLLLLVSRLPTSISRQFEEDLRVIRVELERLVRGDRTRVALARFPWSVHPLGIGHMVLTLLGKPDEACDRLVRSAWEAGQADATERPPFREMDLRWIRGLSANGRRPQAMDDLLEGTALLTPLHPIYATRSDAYAFTHEVMYVTDFGRQPVPDVVHRDGLVTAIDAALAWQVAAEDIDLLVEYLICACLAKMPWSAYCDLAWKCLDHCWEELGFLPSPTFEVSEFLGLPEEARSGYAWRHVYHTTFVAGMLYALLLVNPTAGEAPGAQGELDRRPDPGWVEEAEKQRGTAPALWKRVAPTLVDDADDPRRVVLLDAFLIHAAREYDLGWLSAGLAVALRDECVSLTTMVAAEFLARQQLLSATPASVIAQPN